MTAKQESQFNMFRAVKNHCEANLSTVGIIPAFQISYEQLKTKIEGLSETMQKEDLATKGITIRKAEAKKKLCKFAADVAAPIFAYASTTNNSQLQKEVSFSYTKLLQTKDESLSPRIKNIYDAGLNNLGNLIIYGITFDTFDEFLLLIESYNSKVPDPRNALAIKKTVRLNMKNYIKEGNDILKNQMDKSIVMLKKKNPDFVSTYTANRVIIDPPRGQTQLKGKVTNSMTKEPIEGVTIAIDTFTAVSDVHGKYQINNMRLGTYNLEAIAHGYQKMQQASILIKQGRINSFNFALLPEKK